MLTVAWLLLAGCAQPLIRDEATSQMRERQFETAIQTLHDGVAPPTVAGYHEAVGIVNKDGAAIYKYLRIRAGAPLQWSQTGNKNAPVRAPVTMSRGWGFAASPGVYRLTASA